MSGVPRTIETYSDAAPLKNGFVDRRPSAPKIGEHDREEDRDDRDEQRDPDAAEDERQPVLEEADVDADGEPEEAADDAEDDGPGDDELRPEAGSMAPLGGLDLEDDLRHLRAATAWAVMRSSRPIRDRGAARRPCHGPRFDR